MSSASANTNAQGPNKAAKALGMAKAIKETNAALNVMDNCIAEETKSSGSDPIPMNLVRLYRLKARFLCNHASLVIYSPVTDNPKERMERAEVLLKEALKPVDSRFPEPTCDHDRSILQEIVRERKCVYALLLVIQVRLGRWDAKVERTLRNMPSVAPSQQEIENDPTGAKEGAKAEMDALHALAEVQVQLNNLEKAREYTAKALEIVTGLKQRNSMLVSKAIVVQATTSQSCEEFTERMRALIDECAMDIASVRHWYPVLYGKRCWVCESAECRGTQLRREIDRLIAAPWDDADD